MCKRPLALVLIYFSLFSCVAAQSDQKRQRETAKIRDKIIKCANKPNPFSELKLRHGPKLTGPIYRPGEALPQKFRMLLGYSQYHLAVAGGCAAGISETLRKIEHVYDVPTRYREVVLTVSKSDSDF